MLINGARPLEVGSGGNGHLGGRGKVRHGQPPALGLEEADIDPEVDCRMSQPEFDHPRRLRLGRPTDTRHGRLATSLESEHQAGNHLAGDVVGADRERSPRP